MTQLNGFKRAKVKAAGGFIATLLLLSAASAVADSVATQTLSSRMSNGDYQYVIDALEDKADKSPEQYNLLISALMNEDLDDAEEAADAFIEQYSNDYRAYHMHASVMGAQASNSIFSALGYAEKAKESLEKAVDVAPENIVVYKALMQFHFAAPSIAGGDMEEASGLVEKIGSMNPVEGELARARYLLADGNDEQAIALYESLQQTKESQIQARFELGNYYLQEEQYADAFGTLSPLLSIQLPDVEEDVDSPQWRAYSRDMYHILYGTYRVGLASVKSGTHTQAGIEALQYYLSALDETAIDITDLPSKSWARLRLSELLMTNDQLAEAKATLSGVKQTNDDRFNRILKNLKKKVAKRV